MHLGKILPILRLPRRNSACPDPVSDRWTS